MLFTEFYNKSLADKVRIALLSRDLTFQNKYDCNGNVIRDFRQELNIYSKDEEINLLPKIDAKFFDSHRKFKTHNNRNTDHSPVVNRLTSPVNSIKVELIKDTPPSKFIRPHITIDLINHTEPKVNIFYTFLKRINLL